MRIKKCLKDIVKAYEKVKKLLFIIQCTKLYMVSKTILYYKLYKYQDQLLYMVLKQKLIFEKEKVG